MLARKLVQRQSGTDQPKSGCYEQMQSDVKVTVHRNKRQIIATVKQFGELDSSNGRRVLTDIVECLVDSHKWIEGPK